LSKPKYLTFQDGTRINFRVSAAVKNTSGFF
jgi:hypothetical protein